MNTDIDIAKKLIRQAKLSGANAVKFQLFKSEDVVTKDCKKANYQIKNTKGNNKQLDMLQKLELGHNNYYGYPRQLPHHPSPGVLMKVLSQ